MPAGPKGRRHARGLFFHWLVGLFGLGAGMLAFLLAATGEVELASPVVILLLLFSAAGIVALAAALFIAASRTSHPRRDTH
jgi:uncharacterized membrane protein YhhN